MPVALFCSERIAGDRGVVDVGGIRYAESQTLLSERTRTLIVPSEAGALRTPPVTQRNVWRAIRVIHSIATCNGRIGIWSEPKERLAHSPASQSQTEVNLTYRST